MKKTKLITMAVSFLLTVGMIGAGFASWIISADVEENVDTSVKVETVVDTRVALTVNSDNASVYFGVPETMNSENAWLTASSDAKKQDLSSKVVCTVNNNKALVDAGFTHVEIVASIIISKASLTNVFDLSKMTYIALPSNYDKSDENNYIKEQTIQIPLVNDGSTEKVNSDVEFTFGWGGSFSGSNPYAFFNATDKSPSADVTYYDFFNSNVQKTGSYADFAYSALSALAALNGTAQDGGVAPGMAFTIKLVAKPITVAQGE